MPCTVTATEIDGMLRAVVRMFCRSETTWQEDMLALQKKKGDFDSLWACSKQNFARNLSYYLSGIPLVVLPVIASVIALNNYRTCDRPGGGCPSSWRTNSK
eukprot:760467-Hanusia_phi.AAC.3